MLFGHYTRVRVRGSRREAGGYRDAGAGVREGHGHLERRLSDVSFGATLVGWSCLAAGDVQF